MSAQQPPYKRRRKLIEPRIQLRFAALFLAIASAAVLGAGDRVGWLAAIGRRHAPA